MFGPANPGDDRQTGPAMPVPQIPPVRKFLVTRVKPGAPSLAADNEGGWISNSDYIQVLEVCAHEAELNAAGNILRFREFMIHPVEGPTNRVVRCFNGWFDYEEVFEPVPEPSRIITSVSPAFPQDYEFPPDTDRSH